VRALVPFLAAALGLFVPVALRAAPDVCGVPSVAPPSASVTLPLEAFLPVIGSASPRASAGTPIEVRIELPKTKKVGEKLAPKVVVVNTSKATVSFLDPMDGSHEHMRFPYWDLYARDEKTQQVTRWTYGAMRCGNTNAPTLADHHVLAPGKSASPKTTDWSSALSKAFLTQPGTYTVWVEYAFCGYGNSLLTLGKPETRADVVVGRFASNGVTITVK
jgi:hypothetical protein